MPSAMFYGTIHQITRRYHYKKLSVISGSNWHPSRYDRTGKCYWKLSAKIYACRVRAHRDFI